MKKLLLLFSLFVLMASCGKLPQSDKKVYGQGIVCRVARTYRNGGSYTLIYLENGKIFNLTDDVFYEASLAQKNDTVFYNVQDEFLEIRFHQ